jgi:hypothetical protein
VFDSSQQMNFTMFIKKESNWGRTDQVIQ